MVSLKKVMTFCILCNMFGLIWAMNQDVGKDFIIASQVSRLQELVKNAAELELFFKEMYLRVPYNIDELVICCERFKNLKNDVEKFGEVFRFGHSTQILSDMLALQQKLFGLGLGLNNLREQTVGQLEARATSILELYNDVPKNVELDRKEFEFFKDTAIYFRHDFHKFSRAFSSENSFFFVLESLRNKLAEIEEDLAQLLWQEEFESINEPERKERLDDSDEESTPGADLGD